MSLVPSEVLLVLVVLAGGAVNLAGPKLIAWQARRTLLRRTAAALEGSLALDDVTRDAETAVDGLERELARLARIVGGTGDEKHPLARTLEPELQTLRVLLAAFAIERGAVVHAKRLLALCPAPQEAAQLVAARVELVEWREGAPAPQPVIPARAAPLPESLRTDALAQLAIARGNPDVALHGHALPITRLRALVACGRVEEARALAQCIAPDRLDGMRRNHPEDSATRMLPTLLAEATPYR